MFPVQNDLKQADALLPLGRSRKTRWDWNYLVDITFCYILMM
jgi:hypothetical protein